MEEEIGVALFVAVVYSLYGSSLVHCHLTNGNGELVSWCFEPSQPQRITSGLGNDDEVFLSSITNYNEKCCFLNNISFFMKWIFGKQNFLD